VRLWHEGTADGPRWRGRIEHVQSGESAAFLELDAMLSFLRRFGVEADDRGRPDPKVQRGVKRIGVVKPTTRNR
jgi:hypothetical protein